MTDTETGLFRGAGNVIWELGLPLSEVMQEQLTKGYLLRVNADGSPYVERSADPEGDQTAPEGEPEGEKPPAANASKAHWVGFAHRVHDVSIDDAEAMTKADLIELYGGSQG